MLLQACPHCKTGTLTDDKDCYGRFRFCINCGWCADLDQSRRVLEPLPFERTRLRIQGVRI